MKTTKLKRALSMLIAVLTFMSGIAVTANAEELLPGEYGGAIYTNGEIDMSTVQFENNIGNVQGETGEIGGAIYTDGEIDMSGCQFENNIGDVQGETASIGGAIYTNGEIDISECQFENNIVNVQEETEQTVGKVCTEDRAATIVNPEENSEENNVPSSEDTNTENAEVNELPESAAVQPVGSLNVQIAAETVNETESEKNQLDQLNEAAEEPTDCAEVSDNQEVSENSDVNNSTKECLPEEENCVPEENENEVVKNTNENAETAENLENIEAIASEEESTLPLEPIAGIGIEAKVIPHERPHDPDEEAIRGKNEKICKTIGDALVKLGESAIPFGNTISNFIRARSAQGKNMDNAEVVIDLAADTASYICPIGAPIVSVVKDIALKIRKLF